MSDQLSRAAGFPNSHPPALALDADEGEAISLALAHVSSPTNDDRTAGLAAILRVTRTRSARIAMLANVAVKAIEAARAHGHQPKSDGGPGAPGKPK